MRVSQSDILSALQRVHLFRPLDQRAVLEFIKLCEVVSFSTNEKIFEQDSEATNFYLIIQGKILIELETVNGREKLTILERDDYFGEDVLEVKSLRRTSARALEDCILLKVAHKELIPFIENQPQISPSFELILNNYRNCLKLHPNWIQPEEGIHLLCRPHSFFLVTRAIIPLIFIFFSLIGLLILFNQEILSVLGLWIFGSLALILGTGWVIWNWIDWSNDFYCVTSKRATFMERVALFYESRQETPLAAILSITNRTSLTGRMFSFGDVVIRTYTGVLNYRHIAYPEQVVTLLEELWQRTKQHEVTAGPAEVEKILLERLMPRISGEVESSDTEKILPPVDLKSGWINESLARLFGMRRMEGETIIYRTHWLILLQKTFLPALALFILFLVSAAYAFQYMPFLSSEIFYPILISAGVAVVGWLVYQFIDWSNDCYLITADKVVDINRKPLGVEERREASIKNIQTIEYKHLNIIGVLFNFGTIFIRVGDTEFTFDYVSDPSEVQRELFERYMSLMQVEKDVQANHERQQLADWIDAYHRIVNHDDDASHENKAGDELE
jgi:hypothetical protein